MGYPLVAKVRELIESEAARDAAEGRATLPEALRALVREADAAVLQRAAAAHGCEDILHNLYMRAVCLQAIAQKNPLVEIFPYVKGAMGSYRDAHQLLRELRLGQSATMALGTSVKIVLSVYDEAL